MKKFVTWIVDHPWVVIGAVVLITIGALVAIPHISTQTNFEDYLSKDDPAVAAMDRAEDRYGKQTFFMVSVVAPDTIFKTETLEKIVAMRKEFEDRRQGADQLPGHRRYGELAPRRTGRSP